MRRFFRPAPRLRGRLAAPPDKSLSHRAALLGAMASEPVRVGNYLDAADTRSTLAAIGELGAIVEQRPDGLVIRGCGLREAQMPPGPIDVGNAGTLMRLLPGWLAFQPDGRFTLDGDDSIRRRPVDRIAQPLRQAVSGKAPATELTVEATDRRGRTIEVRVRIRRLIQPDGDASGAIILQERVP